MQDGAIPAIIRRLDNIALRQEHTNRKLDAVLTTLSRLLSQEVKMSNELDTRLDELVAQVKATTDTEQSALTLIQGFSSRLDAAIAAALAAGATAEELAKLRAESDALKTSADALAAAVVANTPAAPTTPA